MKVKKYTLLVITTFIMLYSEAQQLSQIKPTTSPLILKAIGSFYVGGDKEEQNRSEMGGFFPNGHLTVNQMYVIYMVPNENKGRFSFVLIH